MKIFLMIVFTVLLFLFLPKSVWSKTMGDNVEIYLLNQLDDPRDFVLI